MYFVLILNFSYCKIRMLANIFSSTKITQYVFAKEYMSKLKIYYLIHFIINNNANSSAILL